MSADVNTAPIITDLADAQARMNVRLDEIIPSRYRSAGIEHPDIRRWVDQYAQDPAAAQSLLIMGPTGSGKTWAAYGALRAAACLGLRQNRVGRYILGTWFVSTFPDFLAHMRPGYYGQRDEMNAEKYMALMRSTPLLMLDDLGMAKSSEFVEENTHRLISGRYDDERPTIYTTNLRPDELKGAVGDRIASRLAEECIRVVFLGADRRRQA